MDVTTTQVAEGIHFVYTPLANWVVLTDGDEVALVDCGYPAFLPQVRASVRAAVGRDVPVRTVLVTHAHADHIGTAARLVAADGAAVLCSSAEVPGVRREEKYQVDIGKIVRNPRPAVLRWTVQAVRAGGLRNVAVAAATALDGPRVVAGHRVEPVELPGHTPGAVAYWLPDVQVLASGDALVTGNFVGPERGPQMMPRMFHQDLELAVASLDRLVDLDARWVLPGHGRMLVVGGAYDGDPGRRLPSGEPVAHCDGYVVSDLAEAVRLARESASRA